ncbi:MAG: competence protein ComEC, partial [Frankiaceae bacterium]|nr:competence protein ComEC [Frankiaceae bacterium]
MSGRLDLRLALPAGAAWAGAWIAAGGGVRRGLLAAVLGGVLCGRAARRRVWALVAVGGLFGATSLAGALAVARREAGPLPRLAAARAAVTAELVVTGDPRAFQPRVTAPWAGARSLVVVQSRVVRLRAEGNDHRLHQDLAVMTEGRAWLELLPGTRIRAEGRLDVGRDGSALLSARGPPMVLAGPPLVQRIAGRVRAGLRKAVHGRGAAVEGLLPGIVLGDTSRLDPTLKAEARITGLTHLVAVSGFNVAIVLAAVLVAVRRTRAGPRLQALCGLLAVVGFVVLARPSPSVLRAAVMAAVALLALALGRPRAAMPALAGSVVMLLLVDPGLARSYGFVLSVLATAALLTLAPLWSRALVERFGWPRWIADAVAVPAAAHVVTAPVVAMISGQVSVVAVPANLLADPAVAPATLLGLLAAVVSPAAPWLATGLAWLAAWPTRWVAWVAHSWATVPLAALPVPKGSAGLWLVLTGAVLAALAIRRPAGRRAALVGVGAFLVSRVAVAVIVPSWPPPGWALVVCDVGQGDAEVLNTGDRHAVVLDSGPDPAPVRRCLDRLDVRAVDLLVLTHAHSDHLLGLPGVLSGRSVGAVWAGPLREPKEIWDDAVRWLAAVGAPLTFPVPGDRLELPGVGLEVLAPWHAFHGSHSDPNNSSIVLRARLPGFTALLTGDAEAEAQRELLASGEDLRADFLKIPHHGSRFQLPALLDAVHASVAVASVGAGNPYGHPAASTLQRLRDDGALVLRTDHDGSVALLAGPHGVLAVPEPHRLLA